MGSGGTDFAEDTFMQALDVVTNISTFGAVGFDGKSNSFKKGVVAKEGIKGVKDLTGATAAEEANKQAREQFENQKQSALQDRENARASNAARQLQTSRSAGSLSRSTSSNKPSSNNFNSKLGGGERDFLGL